MPSFAMFGWDSQATSMRALAESAARVSYPRSLAAPHCTSQKLSHTARFLPGALSFGLSYGDLHENEPTAKRLVELARLFDDLRLR